MSDIYGHSAPGGRYGLNERVRSVDEVGDELYALPPAAFTTARDAAVAQARADGDPAAARQIAALKRPTQGAFLVNLLALRRPDVVADLIALGERIRDAQGTVSAADLRELTTQRRAALADALALCRSLAAESGAGEPSAAQLGEASETLAAAMADPASADLVRAGRVVKALSYAGFGGGFGTAAPVSSAGGAAARRAAGQAERPPAQPVRSAAQQRGRGDEAGAEPGADEQAAEAERQRREQERAAWERLARAEAALATAQAQERAANEELDRIADEITRLRAALDAATQRARSTRTLRQAAERELAAARRDVSAQT